MLEIVDGQLVIAGTRSKARMVAAMHVKGGSLPVTVRPIPSRKKRAALSQRGFSFPFLFDLDGSSHYGR